jgi:fumarylacetoacetase
MTWLDVDPAHPFGPATLPYGSFTTGGAARVGVAIGEHVLDLGAAAAERLPRRAGLFADGNLDRLLAAGPAVWADVRAAVTAWLTGDAPMSLVPAADVELLLPFGVADYVDFYASEHHARNIGAIFRPDVDDPLTPNWKHLPIGYHGRAGTVVVSGSPVPRPHGQRRTPDGEVVFGPSVRLDIEAEVGFVVGVGSPRGTPVGLDALDRHVFGVCLVNDWSARDIQAWEYVPLGPFLGKSFATSVSAWVTPLAALDAAWCDLPGQDPAPLEYLAPTGSTDGPQGLDLDVEVVLNGEVVSRPPYRTMYWSPAQMLAHLTVNGASTRPGDLFASGTISGPDPDTRGSFLELSWGGKEPFGDGRTFLEDGDEVTLRYAGPGTGGGRITLGEVTGRIEPARP